MKAFLSDRHKRAATRPPTTSEEGIQKREEGHSGEPGEDADPDGQRIEARRPNP